MAIQKFKIEVTRVDEYVIEVDDSMYTDEFIEQWSESFYETNEDSRQEDFAKHLASALTSEGLTRGIEGFGYIKQKLFRDDVNHLLTQYSSELKTITEEDYSPGLLVDIIQYDEDYEIEVFTNNK